MVAAVLFLIGLVGFVATTLLSIAVAVFGFIAVHFFTQFTEQGESLTEIKSDMRAMKGDFSRLSEAFVEVKSDTVDRYTGTQAKKENDDIRDDFHREIADVRRDIEANAKELSRRTNFMEEADATHTSIEYRLKALESKAE